VIESINLMATNQSSSVPLIDFVYVPVHTCTSV